MQQTKDTKEKVRVFALARTLGVDSKTIIDLCKSLGFDVKSQLASLEPDQVEILKQRMLKGGGKPVTVPEPSARPTPPVQLPPKEKKIVQLPPAKPMAKPEPVRGETPAPEALVQSESISAAPAQEVATAPDVQAVPQPVSTIEPTKIPEVVEKPIATPVVKPSEPVVPPAVAVPVAVVEEVLPPREEISVPEVVVSAPTASPPTLVAEVSPTVSAPHEPETQEIPVQIQPVAATAPPVLPTMSTPVAPTTPPATAPLKPVGSAPSRIPTLSRPIAKPPVLSPSRPSSVSSVSPRTPAAPAASAAPPAPPAAPTAPATSTPPARPIAPTSPGPTHRAPSGTPSGAAPAQRSPHGSHPAGPRHAPATLPSARSPVGPRPPYSGGSGTPGSASPSGPRDAAGSRHRRSDQDRRAGLQARQGTGPAPAPGTPPAESKDKKGAPGATPPARRTFSPDELKALREGTTLNELLRKKREEAAAQQAAAAPVAPAERSGRSLGTDDDEEVENKKKAKVPGRETRQTERAKRQEQRKIRQNNIVIEGGHVDIIEDESGTKRGKRPKALLKKKKEPGTLPPRERKVYLTPPITVRSLSEAIGMKAVELILKLKQLTGTLSTINSPVEFEVAELIATEKDLELQLTKSKDAEEDLIEEHKQAQEDESKLEPRAPVVTIMGHVDHGKTSLLDKIRRSNIVATEAGGITQVIRAWRVEHNGKPITFLDTPGHEAFTKMRARGANVTDIAVIVVAANDGVMPQTEEAISHAKAAGVSIIVAINKIDLPDANIKRTEQQLYGLGLLPDTMGGDCQFVYTSASKGTGIDDLLDTITLVAEIKELKANPHKPAMGVCLEAYLSGDEGVNATLLIQQGTLHRGDVVLCGAAYGRVRAMYNDLGQVIKEAGPSVPVRITGLDEVPNADDHFHVVTELSKAREIAEKRKTKAVEATFRPREAVRLENLTEANKPKITELKVILKAEARGSIEAIKKELEKLVHEEVRVRVLHAAIGAITESDVQLALASPEDSIVVGFNVVPDDQALTLAEQRGIKIREYNIIYNLTDDIKSALEGKLKPREEIIHLGRAVVREVFKISRVGTVAGCYVTQGVIERSAKIRVIREGAVIYPAPDKIAGLDSLKHYKDDVREVKQGFECGLKVSGYDDIKVNDVIEAYRVEQVQRTL